MRLILQPCGNKTAKEHYKNTIEKMNQDIDNIKEYITEEEYNDLIQIYPNRKCMIWGIMESNKKKWEKISRGDISLFTGNNKIFSKATVTYKIKNQQLAEFLWGKNSDNKTWEYIYFLDEKKDMNVPYSTFNKIVGYDPNYVIQGFNVLDEEKSNKFIYNYSLESNRYLDGDINNNDYKNIIEEEIKKLNSYNQLDVEVKSRQRREQGFLRKQLVGNKYCAKCSICGNEFPIEFLWCAHIKKRESCSKEEKLDYKNIVTLMCKFGCDDLYEKGFIAVKDGKVTVLKFTGIKYVDDYLKTVENNDCINFNENNKKYYHEHLMSNNK